LNDGRISDAEFDLILKEVEQYKVLRKGLRNADAQNYTKLVNRKNVKNIQFEKRSSSKIVNNAFTF
jgi:hypothetical protein